MNTTADHHIDPALHSTYVNDSSLYNLHSVPKQTANHPWLLSLCGSHLLDSKDPWTWFYIFILDLWLLTLVLWNIASFTLHWGTKCRTTSPINERSQRSVHYNCLNWPSPPSIPFLQGGLTIFVNIALLINLPDTIIALEIHRSFCDGKNTYLWTSRFNPSTAFFLAASKSRAVNFA